MIKVGIPRALLFYFYYPLWRAFFTELDVQVVVSPETNKRILDAGLRTALGEACLPVKLFFGHVLELSDKVDYLFVPRLISVEHKEYICPKFMGLSDMLRARLANLPPIIDIALDVSGRRGLDWPHFFEKVGSIFTRDRHLIKRAYCSALEADKNFRRLLNSGLLPPEAMDAADGISEAAATSVASPGFLKIGLLGHPYNLYDSYISMNLIGKMRQMGASVVTAASVPDDLIDSQTKRLPKRLFWTLGKQMIGTAFTFFENEHLDGVIYLTSFGCGPESLVGELVERWAKHRANLPFMMLTIDEHTGEAGMVTRLEAFTEMIKRRKKHENYVSAYGKPVHCC